MHPSPPVRPHPIAPAATRRARRRGARAPHGAVLATLALLALGGAAGQAPPDDPAAPAPASPRVRDAARALEDARAALRDRRLGLEAEVLLRPEAGLRARDDPPRPLEAEVRWRPEATLSWAPLASEILLAEARVLEAERALVAARRDDAVRRLRLPVERARAAADLAEARRALRDAREEAIAAGAEGREARLDEREAALDLADAERAARGLGLDGVPGAAPASAGFPAAALAAERPDLVVPEPVPARTLRAYRARERRLAATVGVAERRRLDAFVPEIALEAGYAGSDARVRLGIGLDGGRPRGEVGAAWTGTRQERGWATLSLALRLGSDAAAVTRAVDRAHEEARGTLDALAAELEADAARRRAEAEAARARWLLAEARLEAASRGEDAAAVLRAEDAARRDWLRFLGAVARAAAVLEAPVLAAPGDAPAAEAPPGGEPRAEGPPEGSAGEAGSPSSGARTAARRRRPTSDRPRGGAGARSGGVVGGMSRVPPDRVRGARPWVTPAGGVVIPDRQRVEHGSIGAPRHTLIVMHRRARGRSR